MGSSVSGLRVLQLGPLYVEHTRRWVQAAAALGCEVWVGGHRAEGRRTIDFSGVAAGTDVSPDRPSQPATDRHVAWTRELVGDLRPDLVQAHWLPTWGHFAVQSRHSSVAVTPWGCDLYRRLGERGRRALAAADRVVALSPHMRRQVLARGVRPERVHEVDLGVDLAAFRPPAPGERERLRRELGLGPGPVVLSLRSGDDVYNLDGVVAAYRRLRERSPDATLVLAAGDAPLAPEALTALEGDGRGVARLEPVDHSDMPRYLRAADVGVSIPSSDGSPNSVWEALACGLPVVLSDLPQVRERVAGCEAVRVVESAPGAVAAAMAELAGRRERVAGAARRWAQENVDQRDQRIRLERLYAAMAEPRRAREPRPVPPAPQPRRPGAGTATAAAAPLRPS